VRVRVLRVCACTTAYSPKFINSPAVVRRICVYVCACVYVCLCVFACAADSDSKFINCPSDVSTSSEFALFVFVWSCVYVCLCVCVCVCKYVVSGKKRCVCMPREKGVCVRLEEKVLCTLQKEFRV